MTSDNRAADRMAWTRTTLDDPALTLEPASSDASFRSYWRTRHDGTSWIVMDSPPALEDPAPWLAINRQLAATGLHVPKVRAVDLERGFLLIEDLGSRLYLPALTDATVDRLYNDAMKALLRMQSTVDTTGMAVYDRTFLRRELDLMPTWFLGRHLGQTLDERAQDMLAGAFDVLLESALEQPRVFVHRDFHSRNLLVIATDPDSHADDDVSELTNPGIIDFQGALCGPITYDLASLLRDCYIAWEPDRVNRWVEDYRLRLQASRLIDARVDRERFRRWFDLIGLQRHLKVLGIFCRLYYRDGKRGYLDDLPQVYRYVVAVARRYPELTGLLSLLQQSIGERDLSIPAAA